MSCVHNMFVMRLNIKTLTKFTFNYIPKNILKKRKNVNAKYI